MVDSITTTLNIKDSSLFAILKKQIQHILISTIWLWSIWWSMYAQDCGVHSYTGPMRFVPPNIRDAHPSSLRWGPKSLDIATFIPPTFMDSLFVTDVQKSLNESFERDNALHIPSYSLPEISLVKNSDFDFSDMVKDAKTHSEMYGIITKYFMDMSDEELACLGLGPWKLGICYIQYPSSVTAIGIAPQPSFFTVLDDRVNICLVKVNHTYPNHDLRWQAIIQTTIHELWHMTGLWHEHKHEWLCQALNGNPVWYSATTAMNALFGQFSQLTLGGSQSDTVFLNAIRLCPISPNPDVWIPTSNGQKMSMVEYAWYMLNQYVELQNTEELVINDVNCFQDIVPNQSAFCNISTQDSIPMSASLDYRVSSTGWFSGSIDLQTTQNTATLQITPTVADANRSFVVAIDIEDTCGWTVYTKYVTINVGAISSTGDIDTACEIFAYPNPVRSQGNLTIKHSNCNISLDQIHTMCLQDIMWNVFVLPLDTSVSYSDSFTIQLPTVSSWVYLLKLLSYDWKQTFMKVSIQE